MKKIMMMLVAGFAVSNMAAAADDVVDQIDDQEEVSAAGAFDGLYVGAGIGGSFLKNKLDGLEANGVVTDGAGNAVIQGAGKFDGTLAKDNVNRVTGDVFVGYGKAVNPKVYVGGELLLEIAQKKNGLKAFTPELALKVGYVADKNMFYVKAGAARPEAGESDVKISKVVPVVYLGAARSFCNNWSANIEVGYQFQQKKDIRRTVNNEPFFVTGWRVTGDVKSTLKVNEGWKVRAGVARTFSF